MAKFYGKIGFVETREEKPGVWVEVTHEKPYAGDLIRLNRLLQNNGEVNSSLNLSNSISILADPYAIDNMYAMRYIVFSDAKWKITNIEVNFPRINLTIGGLYNA